MKVPHQVIVKAPGLLPMLYKVGELASDLNIPERTLRDWLEAGAPHQRDDRDHIWINGLHFAKWVEQQRKSRRKYKLDNESAYCLRCHQVVKLTEPRNRHIKAKLYIITGVCPQCGATINRGARYEKNDLQGELSFDARIPSTIG